MFSVLQNHLNHTRRLFERIHSSCAAAIILFTDVAPDILKEREFLAFPLLSWCCVSKLKYEWLIRDNSRKAATFENKEWTELTRVWFYCNNLTYKKEFWRIERKSLLTDFKNIAYFIPLYTKQRDFTEREHRSSKKSDELIGRMTMSKQKHQQSTYILTVCIN